MNLHPPFHLMHSTIKQGMITFIIVISCLGCSFFGENAPIEDGLFLSYDFDGSIIRVTFSETASGKFYAILTSGSTEDSTNPLSPENRKIVDKRLATNLGSPYEAGILGPIWVPSSSIKKGGSAHGDPIQEIRNWEGWEVGVVKASWPGHCAENGIMKKAPVSWSAACADLCWMPQTGVRILFWMTRT
ncbi:MAG: hypothetical protein R2860_17515 [Desulfobacterales bacterium]